MNPSRIAVAALALGLAALAFLGVRHAVRDETTLEGEPWTLTNVDGNDVVINVFHGACDTFDQIELIETPAQVALGVIHRAYSGDCIAIGLSECHRVTLQAPLGSRALAYAAPLPHLNNLDELTPSEAPGARAGKPQANAVDTGC